MRYPGSGSCLKKERLMFDYNLHTHSIYCGHGSGYPEEYARKAEEDGLGVLGFTEHLPFPDDRLHSSRMPFAQKDVYENEVLRLKKVYEKKGVDILLGWECDYFPEFDDYYDSLLEKADYLIFGTHYTLKDGEYKSLFTRPLEKNDLYDYARNTIKAMEYPNFSFAAHPDVFFIGYEKFDDEAKAVSKDIISCAISHDLPMEMNGNGMIRASRYDRPSYPMREFWELALEMGAEKFIRNTDAHCAANLTKSIPMLDDLSAELGISFMQVDSVSPFSLKMVQGN